MEVQQAASQVQVMGIDAGGTMTDTFFVRADGRFVVGKAQSNPGDESLAIFNSSQDALAHWGREVDDAYPELVTCVYSGTAMLNRILMRKGLDVGLICNRGFEQIHSMGRALQSYLGYALEDRIHLNTHRYDEPLVPVSRTRGVTERTDVQGKVVIPLREDEVRQATRELVEAGSQAIVICLLQSHKNEESEQRARDVVKDELKKLKADIPVFASVDYYPSRKESHRMNTTILEAYGAEPSRQTLKKVSDRFKKHGAKFDLRVMATHGGTISWKAKELARTIVSGPIGGVIGSKLLGEALGYENIACSDIGGTSFDMALITKGNFAIASDPDMARLVLSLPLVTMDLALMTQVLVNLLDNALKYSPPDQSIEITARIDGDSLVIEISDRGHGVPHHDLKRIFDKFYRIPVPEGAGGTGLGLSICKGIVEAHEGRIRAENRPDGGLSVIVRLPLKRPTHDRSSHGQ